MQVVRVLSLVRELRSHKLHDKTKLLGRSKPDKANFIFVVEIKKTRQKADLGSGH